MTILLTLFESINPYPRQVPLENKKLTSTFCKSSFSDSSNFSSEMIAGVTKYAIGRVGFNGGSFCHSLSPPIAKILYLF